MKKLLLTATLSLLSLTAVAENITLPTPDLTGGKPLMTVLSERRSTRAFSEKELDKQTLSELLWATWGISSSDGKRTVPTALNKQNMDLYVVSKTGIYLYNAQKNLLEQISDKDVRPIVASAQEFALKAPIHLVYVGTQKEPWSAMHAGSMYQNAGLYCASVGLNNVVRGSFDKENLTKALNLSDDKAPLIVQAIGYPPEK